MKQEHLEKLTLAAEELIKATGPSTDLLPFADLMRDFSGARVVTINLYEDNMTAFRFAAVSGDKADLAVLRELTDGEISVGHRIMFTPHQPSLSFPFEIAEVESLEALAAPGVPPQVCRAITEQLDLGKIVLTRLIDKEQPIGNFTIYLSAGRELSEPQLVKLLTRQVSLMLARLQAERSVAQLLREMIMIFDSTQDALFLIEVKSDGRFIYKNANQAMLAMGSARTGSIAGLTPSDLFSPAASRIMTDHLRRCQTGDKPVIFEQELAAPDGRRSWLITLNPIRRGGHVHFIAGSARDVTAEKQSQQKIEYLSYHDQLTGLYNRHYFEDTIKRLDTGRSLPISFLMADVNGLKMSNDVFGHPFGDSLLQKAAGLLSDLCRTEDVVARVGGDEFEVILPRTSLAEAEKIAGRIREAAAAVQVGPVQLSISIGCAVKISQSENIQIARKQAEDNMYSMKTVESPALKNRIIQIIRQKVSNNPTEERHASRCAAMCEAMADVLGLYSREKSGLYSLGLLHDIGKIILPASIVNKPSELTEPEWDEIHRHAEASYRILSAVNEYAILAEYALAHHERWDGTGYPRKIAGQDIPVWSRVLTLVDAFEAMTSPRPWRPAFSYEETVRELRAKAGSQFDPELTELFLTRVAPLFADK